jgi:predicted Zn-dependent protease
LQFNRTQESSADQAAIRFLEATQQSSRGLYKFLGIIENQGLLSPSRQDPYLLTHPITQDRMRTLEKHIEGSEYSDKQIPEQLQIRHNRIRAKIIAYSSPLALVLQKYPWSDQSVWARYGRAMAYYRLPDLKKALELINDLLAEHPDDPYFHEMKAQMLFEHGRVYEAITSYKRAIDLAPPSDVLYQALGMAQVSSDDPALLEDAENNLRQSIKLRPRSATTWRQLAIAYGRQNKMGHYQLALGEEALLHRLKDKAISHATRAEKLFKTGSLEWQQAQDITTAAQNMK